MGPGTRTATCCSSGNAGALGLLMSLFQGDVVGHGRSGACCVLGNDAGAVAEEVDQAAGVEFLTQVAKSGVAGPKSVDPEDFEACGECP